MATTERDLYEVLGVPREATDAEIKRAFRKLAQQWHPDVNKDPEAPARFKEASEAYQILSDPERRQRYDMFGRAGVKPLVQLFKGHESNSGSHRRNIQKV